jgi:hypothetical protein
MFARLEKVGKAQSFGRPFPRRIKLEATVGQKNGQIDEGVASLEQNKNQKVGMRHTQKCKSEQG